MPARPTLLLRPRGPAADAPDAPGEAPLRWVEPLLGEPPSAAIRRHLADGPGPLALDRSPAELAVDPGWPALAPLLQRADGADFPLRTASPLRGPVLALGALLVSTAAALLPLALSLPDGFDAAYLGDWREQLAGGLWSIEAVGRALSTGSTHDASVFWPIGVELPPLLNNPLISLLGHLLAQLAPQPLGWNLLFALLLIGNGLGAALLCRQAGGGAPGVLLAAALASSAGGVLVGRGDVGAVFLLPGLLAVVVGLRAQRSGAVGASLGAAALLVLAALAAPQHGAAAVAILGLAALQQARRGPRAPLLRSLGWTLRGLAPASLLWLTQAAELNRGDSPGVQRWWTLPEAATGGLSFTLQGAAMMRYRFDPTVLFDGIGPALRTAWIAALLLLALRRPAARAWAGGAALVAVLAMGPWMDSDWTHLQSPLNLPFSLLQAAFPPAARLLYPDRLLPWAWALFAVAIGLLGLPAGRGRPLLPGLILGAALALPALDPALPLSTAAAQAPAWAAALPGPGPVLNLPLAISEAALRGALFHRQPVVGGPWEPWLLQEATPIQATLRNDPLLRPLLDADAGAVTPALLEALAERGLRTIVVHEAAITALEQRRADQPLTRLAAAIDAAAPSPGQRVGGVSIYTLDAAGLAP